MPSYDYHCNHCNADYMWFRKKGEEQNDLSCPTCLEETAFLGECKGDGPPAYLGSALDKNLQAKGNWEHIAIDPIEVRDKVHLKDVCQEHGCHAPGVLE